MRKPEAGYSSRTVSQIRLPNPHKKGSLTRESRSQIPPHPALQEKIQFCCYGKRRKYLMRPIIVTCVFGEKCFSMSLFSILRKVRFLEDTVHIPVI